jgi:hypothetical protein
LRFLYRVRQFFGGLTAHVSEADRREAEAVLPLPARAWFRSLPRDLQWHGLRVTRELKQTGMDRPEVLAAALLHDAGKAAGPSGPIWRTLVVLVRHFMPDWFKRWAQVDWRSTRGLARVMAVAQQHPEIAAEQAEACGCDPLTIDLIRRHQDRASADENPLLAALQRVDDRS